MTWQKIDTAKQDDEAILLASEIYQYVTIGWYDDDAAHYGEKGFCWWDSIEEGYRVPNFFTHWMPLPAPPKEGEE